MGIYDGFAFRTGIYASRLEFAWAQRFRAWEWSAEYIGDQCWWADFDIGGIKVEVKPEGDEFVMQAAARTPAGNIIVIEGSPGFSRWWFVDCTSTAIPFEGSPRIISARVVRNGESVVFKKSRVETLQEFMDRNGCRFE